MILLLIHFVASGAIFLVKVIMLNQKKRNTEQFYTLYLQYNIFIEYGKEDMATHCGGAVIFH